MEGLFDALIGNSLIKRQLKTLLASEKCPHALLFAGPSGVGKRRFASVFAKALVRTSESCHPDIITLSPEGKRGVHSIESIRKISKEVYFPPYSSTKKVLIIEQADLMLPTSSNALLKTFEEPPKSAVIILVSDQPERLLPTIYSRCFHLNFSPISKSEIKTYLQVHYPDCLGEHAAIAARSNGSLEEAIQWIEDTVLQKQRSFLFQYLVEKRKDQLADLFDGLEAFGKICGEMRGASGIPSEELKALEGIATLKIKKKVLSFLSIVVSFERDLHLLVNGGDPSYLTNLDFHALLLETKEKRAPISSQILEKAMIQANLRLDQSAPITHILEEFFLTI